MNPSIYLIQSQDIENSSIGTGFTIYQDAGGSYLLTCAHVVEQVREPKIDDFVVEVVAIGSSDGIDLAVLYVKGLFSKIFRLQNRHCSSRDVLLRGYSGFTRDKVQEKSREALILGHKVTLKQKKNNSICYAWQIVAKNRNQIEAGNSGGPLICEVSSNVIAVVSNNKGVTEGYAISVEHLADIWEEMPSELLELEENPFVGLSAFSRKDSELFFGREQEISDVMELLQTEAIIALVGDSSIGKSSLIKAGVIPQYLSINENNFAIESRPARNPFNELATVIPFRKLGWQSPEDIAHFKKELKSQNPEEIREMFEDIFINREIDSLLLYIDQFDELFTLCDREIQESFLQTLLYILNSQTSKLKIQIVLTMRKDYIDILKSHEEFYAQIEEYIYPISRMRIEQLRLCIIEPLENSIVSEEEANTFADFILKDIGKEFSELAPLEVALAHIWEHKKRDNIPLLESYREIGGVRGALEQLISDTLNVIGKKREGMLKSIFLRVIKLDKSIGITGRLADRDEFSVEEWELIELLSFALDSSGHIAMYNDAKLGRLLKIRRYKEGDREIERVELIHATLTKWSRYREWLKEVTYPLKRIHDSLIEKRRIYSQNGKKREFLLVGYELEEASRLLNEDYIELLTPDEVEYINQSRKEDNRNKTLKKIVLFTGIGLMLLSIYLAQLFYNKKRELEFTVYNIIIQEAKNTKNPQKAKRFYAKAVEYSPNSEKKEESLKKYHQLNRVKLERILIHQKIKGVRVSSDKKRLLSWGEDWIVRLWDIESEKIIATFRGHSDNIHGARFTKDEKRVLSWSRDGTVKLWSVENQKLISTFGNRDSGYIRGAVFDKDEKQILVWGGVKPLSLWSIKSGKKVKSFNYRYVYDAKFSKDNRLILACSTRDKSAKIWDIQNNKIAICTSYQYKKGVYGVDFVNDEKQIMIRSADNTIKIWDINATKPTYTIQNGDNPFGAVFDQKRAEILSWSEKSPIVRLWSLDDTTKPILKIDHKSSLLGANFTKDKNIITWGKNGEVKLWSRKQQRPLFLLKHKGSVENLLFGKDEKELITTSFAENSIKFWTIKGDDFVEKVLGKKEYNLEAEVESGLKATTYCESVVLSKEEWERKRGEYEVLNGIK